MQNKIYKELSHLFTEKNKVEYAKFFKQEYTDSNIAMMGIKTSLLQQEMKKGIFTLSELESGLKSKIHDIRKAALYGYLYKYLKSESKVEKTRLYNSLVKNSKYINNWDLVDTIVYKVHGPYLAEYKNREEIIKILTKWIKSKNMWERRTALVLNKYFIWEEKNYEYLKLIAPYVFDDKEDLIQKANGWMLKEMGQSNKKELDMFLIIYKDKMSSKLIRYINK